MEPLKNVYNKTFYSTFLDAFKKVVVVDSSSFFDEIFIPQWQHYELKQRMRHTTKVVHLFLDTDFKKAIIQIKKLISVLEKKGVSGGFEYLFLPDYIELYGQNHVKESICSFETITPFVSCEFAIRPFIITNSDYVIAKMLQWSLHPNKHLRRLASEGCRPRLPWGTALAEFKTNPEKIIPILKNLLNDNELYVRKSVANNLNDISKDHKEILIHFTEQYYGKTAPTNWILKHANRNLLKQAEPRILNVFGFGNHTDIDLQNFKINTSEIFLGDDLFFEFNLINNHHKPLLIRLEYAVYYLKKNGNLSKKIFQIGEKKYLANSTNFIHKKQHFKPISTRKYHFGTHKIALIANGKEFNPLEFKLNETH